MKRTWIICLTASLLLGGAAYTFADPVPKKPSPSPVAEGKRVFHTGLAITTDPKAYEARLQITQATLDAIRKEAGGTSSSTMSIQRMMNSSTRTIMAGLFMFLAVSFAGVWLARSSKSRSQKVLAAVVVGAITLGLAAIIGRANAGPPGYVRWQNLPDNLAKGQETRGGLEIEIVPEGDGMKLIVPLKKKSSPGEEE